MVLIDLKGNFPKLLLEITAKRHELNDKKHLQSFFSFWFLAAIDELCLFTLQINLNSRLRKCGDVNLIIKYKLYGMN